MFGNVDAARSWVASGADINMVTVNGTTPLMWASHNLHAECVAEMLRLGADARHVNTIGRTALHEVARDSVGPGDGGEVVRLLAAAGCDAAVRDSDGRTAAELGRDLNGAEWATVFEGCVAASMA